MTCPNNIFGLQQTRATEALSSPPDRSSPSHPSSSIRSILASLCQQADLKAGRASTQEQETVLGVGKDIPSKPGLNSDGAPGKTDVSYAIEN